MLEILAENIYSIILRNQLLAYIETPSVHLVQFQFEEVVDNLFVYAGMYIRILHKRKSVKSYVFLFHLYAKIQYYLLCHKS